MNFWVSKEKFDEALKNWARKQAVFVPYKKDDDVYEWRRFKADEPYTLQGYRTVLPPKYFFYTPVEVLKSKQVETSIICGIRPCDLRELQLLRKIYLNDPSDPFFREQHIIITADCTECGNTCFCVALGKKPYVTEEDAGYDLNLTAFEDGYIVTVGSARGEKLLKEAGVEFIDVSEKELARRDTLRRDVTEKVEANTDGRVFNIETLKKAIEQNTDVFAREALKCVSCTACTNVCPGCFCFLLGETQVRDGVSDKIRYVDSCQHVGYARVGGGHNPRKEATARFKHRFLCKFSFRVDMQGMTGCSGCGRCVDGCQGGIDFLAVITEIYEKYTNTNKQVQEALV